MSQDKRKIWIENIADIAYTPGTSTAIPTIAKVIYSKDKVTKSPCLADWQNKFPNADVTKWEINEDGPSKVFIGNKQQEGRLDDEVRKKLQDTAAIIITTKRTPGKTPTKRQRSSSAASMPNTQKRHKIEASFRGSTKPTTPKPNGMTADPDTITKAVTDMQKKKDDELVTKFADMMKKRDMCEGIGVIMLKKSIIEDGNLILRGRATPQRHHGRHINNQMVVTIR
ncbi:hypothetical protein NXS19_012962 [Fusarium pseudograminearum]|nr:hypothetical protein NXS19_012962 [Fusarium pseudograminearum]